MGLARWCTPSRVPQIQWNVAKERHGQVWPGRHRGTAVDRTVAGRTAPTLVQRAQYGAALCVENVSKFCPSGDEPISEHIHSGR